MISGTIAESSSFTVYPLGEITIPRTSYSYYYISYTPSSAAGTMWIRSTSVADPVSYQLSSYSGMLKFGNSYPQYLSFKSCNWISIKTNIPMFNESLAFARCSTLQNADLYNCTSLSLSAFQFCTSLSQVSLPMCSIIGSCAFSDCRSLSKISLPVCTYIENNAFFNCRSLLQISLPMCSHIYLNAFNGCTSLIQISLPACSVIEYQAFAFCNKLTQIYLPICGYIGGGAFRYCSSLSIITIGYSSVCSLYGSNVFNYTPIASGTGSIYVPASLVDSYKSAPNWSYFSAIIQSYPGL